MATIKPTFQRVSPMMLVVTWEGMADGDDGAPAQIDGYAARSVQATGDGTGVTIEGSNDGVNFAGFSTAVSLNANNDEIETIPDVTRFVQVAELANGDDTTVILVATATR